jgi:hypothetical protein
VNRGLHPDGRANLDDGAARSKQKTDRTTRVRAKWPCRPLNCRRESVSARTWRNANEKTPGVPTPGLFHRAEGSILARVLYRHKLITTVSGTDKTTGEQE